MREICWFFRVFKVLQIKRLRFSKVVYLTDVGKTQIKRGFISLLFALSISKMDKAELRNTKAQQVLFIFFYFVWSSCSLVDINLFEFVD